MRGHVLARHNLGCVELNEGNIDRALKHFMISAGAGDDKSLKAIRDYFFKGYTTKDDFEKALCSHKEAHDEMKSDGRAAAVHTVIGRQLSIMR